MTSEKISVNPGFIGSSHPAFCINYRPPGAPKAHIVYLPPFAEEMNRCRAIVAEQARWFANQGVSCSILDFYGTGESPGKLEDATLAIWNTNIGDLSTALVGQADVPIYLWGCRLGTLLAVNYLKDYPGTCPGLLLWQPVVSGKLFITQMLRQRTAALMERGEAPESTTDIRNRLYSGECVEVAGYVLGKTLIAEIEQLDMGAIDRLPTDSIFWLEHSIGGTGNPSPRSTKTIALLREKCGKVEYHAFTGQPLWQLHERDTCEDLLEVTRALPL